MMRCYFHNEKEAVGVCSYCHRAVCGKDCTRFEDRQLLCKEHSARLISLQFTKYYLDAIDLAREAGLKGLPITKLLEKLKNNIEAEVK